MLWDNIVDHEARGGRGGGGGAGAVEGAGGAAAEEEEEGEAEEEEEEEEAEAEAEEEEEEEEEEEWLTFKQPHLADQDPDFYLFSYRARSPLRSHRDDPFIFAFTSSIIYAEDIIHWQH